MEKWNEAIQKAGVLYDGNCHCCEAIVLSISEHFDYKNDLLLRISTPFGGGMINNGSVCGALVAAYLCAGIFKGRTSEEESRNDACEIANRIFQKFCQKYGPPNCKEITGYDKKDPKAVALYAKQVKSEVCIPLTKEVTRWILEELDP